MRTLGLLALLTSGTALAGEPILVPDFTPASTTEFAVAFMLQQQVEDTLRDRGYIVLDSPVVASVVGDSIAACAEVPGCPFAALQQLPARAAVVGRVARTAEGSLSVYVAAYEAGDSRPVDSREMQLVGGAEQEVADEVATMVDDFLSLLGPPPPGAVMAAVELIEAADAPPPIVPPSLTPPAVTPPPPQVGVPPAAPPPALDWAHGDLGLLLDGSPLRPRHLVGGEVSFRRQQVDGRAWMHRTMPHAGRAIIGLRTGVGIGDVNRTADVRVGLDFQGLNATEWVQEGPLPGSAIRGSIFFGYAPSMWVDVGVAVGLQYGERTLTTGYTDPDGNSNVSAGAGPAVQFVLQPRVRAYLVPLGPVKPYLFGGAEVRLFDPYQIVDPPQVDYPNPPGGAYAGPLGGGGFLFDPSPVVGFFVEGGATAHFGARAAAAQSGNRPVGAPEAPVGVSYTIAAVGGVQFRI